jgi:hypothetical protein
MVGLGPPCTRLREGHPESGAPAGGIRLPIARANAGPVGAAEGKRAPGATPKPRAGARPEACAEHGEDGEDATLTGASTLASSLARWASCSWRPPLTVAMAINQRERSPLTIVMGIEEPERIAIIEPER